MGFAITGPDSIILNQGESTPAMLQIVRANKPWRNVGLTVSGLPNGVTAEFFPSNGKPSFNSTMTLRSADNSVTGTCTIIVTARDARSSQTMPIIFSNYQPPNVAPPLPAPVLTSLSPSSITEDTGAFTLTVNGSNFMSGAVVKWNGSNRTTTFVNSGQVTAAILAGDITTPGTASITMQSNGLPSNALTFTINSAVSAPVLSSLSPSSITEDTGAFTLTVNGSGFVSGATVFWNGSSRTTTFVGSTQVTAAILAGDITTPGTASVTATNPGSSASNTLTFTINASGATYDHYMATAANGGSNSNPGTLASPWLTFAYAFSQMSGGESLFVGAGTYTQNINAANIPSGSNFSGGETKIIGAGVASTKIFPSSGDYGIEFTNNGKSYIEFSDFEIDGTNLGYSCVWMSDGSAGNMHHIRFRRMNWHHAAQQGILATDAATDLEFFDVEIHHIDSAFTCPGGAGLCHGMYIKSNNVLIDRASLHDNSGYGIQYYPNPTGGLMRNSIVYNNALDSNPGAGIGLFGGGTNKAVNNTIYQHNSGKGMWVNGSNIARNNIIYLASAGTFVGDGTDDHNLKGTNPNFVNAGAANFRLNSGSAAIGAGISDSSASTDRDGVSRPAGGSWDAGAYEFV